MNSTDNEVLSIFKETKALLEGHFILRSACEAVIFSNALKFVSIWIK